jgi:hypothetical protein
MWKREDITLNSTATSTKGKNPTYLATLSGTIITARHKAHTHCVGQIQCQKKVFVLPVNNKGQNVDKVPKKCGLILDLWVFVLPRKYNNKNKNNSTGIPQ